MQGMSERKGKTFLGEKMKKSNKINLEASVRDEASASKANKLRKSKNKKKIEEDGEVFLSDSSNSEHGIDHYYEYDDFEDVEYFRNIRNSIDNW